MRAPAHTRAALSRVLAHSRRRSALALISVVAVGAGAGVGLAQSDSASDTPFGKPTAEVPNPGANITAVPGTRSVGGYKDQTRSEVVARNGIAATSNPLATQTANRILLNGGNAIDAAVAAAATLSVVEPNATGLGGDLFAIVWSARDKKLYALASSGWAPERWTPEYFASRGLDEVPARGINSAVVPGTVAGWDALLDRFGTMGFRKVLEPAVDYAEEGFGVHERAHSAFVGAAGVLREDPDSARTWLPSGQPPRLYSIFSNPEMARALRLIQRQGRDAFYEGRIARAIVAKSRRVGGAIRRADLARFESEWVDTVSTDYHGYDIHQLPPPNQGFAALEMLNILEVCVPELGLDLAALGPRNPQYWHLLIEAKKLAYSDLHRYNADPKFAPPPLETLLSKEYAASLCKKIDPNQARPADVKGNIGGGTVAFSTADRWGNMVSFVNSNFSNFGSGVTVPGFGFVLANRGRGFTLDQEHPNVVAPRKRPFITITSPFITKDGQPVMAFGTPGGAVQPQAHAQHIVNMVDLGMNVQATADVARFDHNQAADRTTLDTYLFDLVGPQLQERGHNVRSGLGVAGAFAGILFERDPRLAEPRLPRRGQTSGPAFNRPVNGVYRAGADRRRDGMAAGW